MKSLKLELSKSDWGAIQLTKEQAIQFGIDTEKEEIRAEIKTRGSWNIISGYKALCVSVKYKKGLIIEKESITLYGKRSMGNIRDSGYHLEGQVSLKGKKVSCYSSTELFSVDGVLVNVQVIGARINK
jgi:hypothetical protein